MSCGRFNCVVCRLRILPAYSRSLCASLAHDVTPISIHCAMSVNKVVVGLHRPLASSFVSSVFSYHLQITGMVLNIPYHYSTLSCPVRPPHVTPYFQYILYASFHLVFCLLLRLFHGIGASNVLLSTCPSFLLLTCPYHVSLFSVIIIVTRAIFFTDLSRVRLLKLKCRQYPAIHANYS